MLLGSLMARFQSDETSGALLEAMGDVVLLARVHAAGEMHDESPGEYASGAAARFSHQASDEDWLALMNVIERTDDPASACLRHMLEWSLKSETAKPVPHEGCTCGGGGGCHDSA